MTYIEYSDTILDVCYIQYKHLFCPVTLFPSIKSPVMFFVQVQAPLEIFWSPHV